MLYLDGKSVLYTKKSSQKKYETFAIVTGKFRFFFFLEMPEVKEKLTEKTAYNTQLNIFFAAK